MPIYEYRCTKCGEQTEVLQRFGDPPKRKCGKCSGRLEKLISRTAFLLKGGGWFAEGYTPGSDRSEKKKKTDAKSESGATESGKSSTEKKASSA